MLNIHRFLPSALRPTSGKSGGDAKSILLMETALNSQKDKAHRSKQLLDLMQLYRKRQLFPDVISASAELLGRIDTLSRGEKVRAVEILSLALHIEGRTNEAVGLIESDLGSCLSRNERQILKARYLAGLKPKQSLALYRTLPAPALAPSDLRIFCQLLMRAGEFSDVRDSIDGFAKRRGRLRPIGAPLAAELALLRYEAAFRQDDIPQLLPETAKLFEALKFDAAPSDLRPEELTALSASTRNRSRSSGGKVSILMTTFNSAEWVAMSIFSLLRQTYTNFELIIVDDCSSDGVTPDLIRGWAKRDKRIKILKTAVNSGTYVAKNLGLDVATGDLVTFHDSDDWAHPHRIESQVEALEAGSLIATQSQWFKISADGCPILKHWGSYIYSNPASIMVRRKVFDDLGKFDTVRIGADTEFIGRVRCYYGEPSYSIVPRTLTIGLERQNALTGSGVGQMDASGFNAVRSAYSYAWRRWHLKVAAGVSTDIKIDRSLSDPFPLPVQLRG